MENYSHFKNSYKNILKLAEEGSFEYDIASRGIFLPIDQRYSASDLKAVTIALGYE